MLTLSILPTRYYCCLQFTERFSPLAQGHPAGSGRAGLCDTIASVLAPREPERLAFTQASLINCRPLTQAQIPAQGRDSSRPEYILKLPSSSRMSSLRASVYGSSPHPSRLASAPTFSSVTPPAQSDRSPSPSLSPSPAACLPSPAPSTDRPMSCGSSLTLTCQLDSQLLDDCVILSWCPW